MKDLRIVRLLVGYGADVNGKDMKFDTPLSLASYSDWGDQMKALVQLLLEFGAGSSINEGGTIYERSPLHWAARHGNIEIVAILLNYGADVKLLDATGFTAFRLAMEEGHQEIMNLLERTRLRRQQMSRSTHEIQLQNGWPQIRSRNANFH